MISEHGRLPARWALMVEITRKYRLIGGPRSHKILMMGVRYFISLLEESAPKTRKGMAEFN